MRLYCKSLTLTCEVNLGNPGLNVSFHKGFRFQFALAGQRLVLTETIGRLCIPSHGELTR